MQTQIHNFALLRRPLLPEQTISDFHQRVSNNLGSFKEELLRIFSDPVLSDSIYLASPTLYRALRSEMASSERSAPIKMYLALYKYLIRMSSRCTPFGFFAGCSTVELRSHAAVGMSDISKARPAIRLDSRVAWQLCQYWQHQDELSSQLLYFPNSSLRRAPGCFQYMERIYEGSGHFTWTEVEYSQHLDQLLVRAANGCSIESLLLLLASMKVDTHQGLSYIKKLIESQVLVSELEAFCIHDDFLGWAASKIGSLKNAETHLNNLNEIAQVINSDVATAQKAGIINQLLKKNYQIADNNHCPLQVDLFFPYDKIALNKTAVQLIISEFDSLSVLAQQKENTLLSRFAAAFH